KAIGTPRRTSRSASQHSTGSTRLRCFRLQFSIAMVSPTTGGTPLRKPGTFEPNGSRVYYRTRTKVPGWTDVGNTACQPGGSGGSVQVNRNEASLGLRLTQP